MTTVEFLEDKEEAAAKKVPYVLGRMPETNSELWLFVKATWGIEIPYRAVCPGHVAPFQAFADAFFARSPVAIWKASRGFGGKTFTLSLLGMTEMVALGIQVAILGGSGEQSRRVHESMQTMWEYEYSPSYLLEHETQFVTRLRNGGNAKTLMASQRSVRGLHPQRLRLDEIDEMDINILTASQGQPMRSRKKPGVDTQTVMSSTHQYPDGTMTKMMNTARERNWPIYHWCFRETSAPGGWLSPDEVERKRSEISQFMWETEYDLQEPSFDGRAIATDSVEKMFDASSIYVPGSEGKYYQFEPYSETANYITGIDWAQEKDWTIIWTFDATRYPWKTVAWQRVGRIPWPAIIAKANKRLEKYPGKMIHDSTGIGKVIKDYLIIPDSMHRRDVIDQVMAGRKRQDMISEYVAGIESDLLSCPRIEWAYNEHKYATNDDLYGNGHLPDTIAAGCLAWSLRKRDKKIGSVPAMDSESLQRSESPWRL